MNLSIINSVFYDINFGREKKFFILFFSLFLCFFFLLIGSSFMFMYSTVRLPIGWAKLLDFLIFGVDATFTFSLALFSAVKLSKKKFQIISIIPLIIFVGLLAMSYVPLSAEGFFLIVFLIIPLLISSSVIYLIAFIRYYKQATKSDKIMFLVFFLFWIYIFKAAYL